MFGYLLIESQIPLAVKPQ